MDAETPKCTVCRSVESHEVHDHTGPNAWYASYGGVRVHEFVAPPASSPSAPAGDDDAEWEAAFASEEFAAITARAKAQIAGDRALPSGDGGTREATTAERSFGVLLDAFSEADRACVPLHDYDCRTPEEGRAAIAARNAVIKYVAELRARVASLTEQLATYKLDPNDVRHTNDRLRANNGALNVRATQAEAKLASLTEENARLTEERKQLMAVEDMWMDRAIEDYDAMEKVSDILWRTRRSTADAGAGT
jgi:hypothetical protein